VSCEQSGVPVAGLQVQHVYWLPPANRQKPDAYGVDLVDCIEHFLAPRATID